MPTDEWVYQKHIDFWKNREQKRTAGFLRLQIKGLFPKENSQAIG